MKIKTQWRDQRRNWNMDGLSVAVINGDEDADMYIHLQCDGALLRMDYLNASFLASVLSDFINEHRMPRDGFERLTD